jgi:hypothetical protein
LAGVGKATFSRFCVARLRQRPRRRGDRLHKLADLRIDRVQVLAGIAADGRDLESSKRLLAEEVMPALREYEPRRETATVS